MGLESRQGKGTTREPRTKPARKGGQRQPGEVSVQQPERKNPQS